MTIQRAHPPNPYRSTPRTSASFSTSVHVRYPFRLFFLFYRRIRKTVHAFVRVSRCDRVRSRTQNVGEFQGIRFDARARRLKRTNVVALDTVPMFTSSSRPLTMRSFAVFFAIPLVTCARLFVLSGLAVSISQFLSSRARH